MGTETERGAEYKGRAKQCQKLQEVINEKRKERWEGEEEEE